MAYNLISFKKQELLLVLFIVFFVSFSVISCKDKQKPLPPITGKACEVVIVIDNKYWESNPGEALKVIMNYNTEVLPQHEPAFDAVNIPEEAFTNIFKTHRNIIYCKTESGQKPEINVVKDLYATQQIFIEIKASDASSLTKLISDNTKLICDYLLDAEKKRIVQNYQEYTDKEVSDVLVKKFGFSLTVPKGYKIDILKDNFAWVSYETPEISQGILIYIYPYVDTSAFQKDSLISVRNYYCKNYVPGPRAGSYMSTESNYDIFYGRFMMDSLFVARIQGLWKTEGDYMGGPFVSYSIPDVNRARIITVDGYVYAPKFDKRNYLRQLEAILSTIRLR